MKSQEKYVTDESNYFLYLPSASTQSTFFYPICAGLFFYEAGYHLYRDSYNSFLLMYIQKGQVNIELNHMTYPAYEGSFVLLDCYSAHKYYSVKGYECLWLHFDGPVARNYYEMIVTNLGNVFTMSDPYSTIHKLKSIYDAFLHNDKIKDALMSKLINDILTSFLLCESSSIPSANCTDSMEEIVSYIHEHIDDDLTVSFLAQRAMLSQYHFIRVFKKHLGFTPYEYIRNLRLNTAKYLLKTTNLSIKDICFRTNFSNESVFCSAFKKEVGCTPSEYRST